LEQGTENEKMKAKFICFQCGTEFERYESEMRRNKSERVYCSAKCRNLSWIGSGNPNYGHTNSQEVRERMSRNHKGVIAWNKGLTKEDSPSIAKYAKQLVGNQFGKANKGHGKQNIVLRKRNLENNPMKNPETRDKMIASKKGKMVGEENPNWNGGTSFTPYCPKFNRTLKDSIRDEFNRGCLICERPESELKRKLHVHHVDYDREQGCNGKKWALVPLCGSCHTKTNYNKGYWIELINSLLYSKRFKVILWL